MNIDIAQDEQVHDAVPMLNIPLSQPISFEVAKADIDHMRAEAAGLQIAGPDDKAGFKTVYDLRQVIKRQRVAVKKRQDELKRPHIDYNREVDQLAKELTEPMEEIENGLALKEKAYNDERDRIAREKALFLQKRTEGRINQLRAIGYEWNPSTESYSRFYYVDDEEKTDVINFDDIKQMEDEEYAPILTDAQAIHEAEQARLAEEKRRYKEEQERIKAEQKAQADQLAEERRVLDEQQAALKRQQDELNNTIRLNRGKRLIEAGYTESSGNYFHPNHNVRYDSLLSFTDEQFDALIQQAVDYDRRFEERKRQAQIEEAERIKAEQKAEKEKLRANRERQKLLAPDKKTVKDFFKKLKSHPFPFLPDLQPETVALLGEFNESLAQLINQYQTKVDEL